MEVPAQTHLVGSDGLDFLGIHDQENHDQDGWIDNPQVCHPDLVNDSENEGLFYSSLSLSLANLETEPSNVFEVPAQTHFQVVGKHGLDSLGIYGQENHEQYGWKDGPQVSHPDLVNHGENEGLLYSSSAFPSANFEEELRDALEVGSHQWTHVDQLHWLEDRTLPDLGFAIEGVRDELEEIWHTDPAFESSLISRKESSKAQPSSPDQSDEAEPSIHSELDEIPMNQDFLASDKVDRFRKEKQYIRRFFAKHQSRKLGWIEHPSLSTFTEKFLEEYDALQLGKICHRIGLSTSVNIENLPVCKYHGCIRPVVQSTGKIIQRQSFYRHIKKLVTWAIYLNTAVLRRLTQESLSKNETFSHHQLTDWLVKEIFHPKHSFPVVGFIEENQERFQELQTNLILYFSESVHPESDLLNSCLLILQFYHTQSHQISKFLLKGSLGLGQFQFLVEDVLSNAVRSKMKIQNENRSLIPARCGNFSIPDLSDYCKHVIPRSYFDLSAKLKGKPGWIVAKIENFNTDIGNKCHYRTKFKNLPVHLLQTKHKKSGLQGIRVTHRHQETIQNFEILRRSRALLLHLMFCHSILMIDAHPELNEVELSDQVLKESQAKFLDWLSDELFGKSEVLPLFGVVEMISPPFDSTRFSETQLVLIDYFSQKYFFKSLQHVSIALNGFWYKKIHPTQWEKYFSNDKSYWQGMIDLLNKHKTHFNEFQINLQVDEEITHSYPKLKGKIKTKKKKKMTVGLVLLFFFYSPFSMH
ncbi:hypothetical protein PGTUg99_033656 [Puccinia graminis f. sp. tritici]|uniref:Uncharacterized protein n=1 Tax=Puccinia graminis f. sp. tritici TaxID=56615 RepID=A0A5B0S1Z1_PUCGR|nr:hypothetical protein PGTUg99_033656 [Puccinia graminis f. sp. tritici]